MPVSVVAAAVIERDGRFLVARRASGHLAGLWEFPGGKCEPGESLEGCLAREMGEELDVGVRDVEFLHLTRHDYADRSVELHFFRAELLGEPRPMLGQEIAWVARGDLASLEWPPADAELVARLGMAGSS